MAVHSLRHDDMLIKLEDVSTLQMSPITLAIYVQFPYQLFGNISVTRRIELPSFVFYNMDVASLM